MKKGFTLIELLIVIGILGILAAGLLAAIDPLDQLRKGRDQTKRNISVELVNALNRYYASRGSMPWGGGGGLLNARNITVAGGTAVIGGSEIVQILIDNNELKSSFFNGIPREGNSLYIYSDVGTNVYSCVRQEARGVNVNAVYHDYSGNIDDTAGETCYKGTGTTQCYFCAR